MLLGVLLLCLVAHDRTSMGSLPVNSAKVAGQPFVFLCGSHSSDSFIQWKFQSIFNPDPGNLFNGYNISRDRPGFFISSSRSGQFNIAKNIAHLEDAGAYQCIQRIAEQRSYRTEIGIAQLTVLASVPICGWNASSQGIVEGDYLLMWCSVSYSGNLDPVMQWSNDDGNIINSTASYVKDAETFTLTTTVSEMMSSSDRLVTYICTTYFKTPTIIPDKTDTFTARNAPDYRDDCRLTSSILFGPRNLFITPLKNVYLKDEQIHCSASGNPPPAYTWNDIDTGNSVQGQVLTANDVMEHRRINHFRCTAENNISGELKAAFKTIAFTVSATVWDSPSGGLLTVIIATGAAVGGVVVTVIGVIVWRLANKKCNNQPCEKEFAESRGSPHDYDSVNSGDMDFNQQTPDVEMDLSTTVVNQATEAEEGLPFTETLSHYDTLDDCHAVPERRPYSSLGTPNPEDHTSYDITVFGKPNYYYNVKPNSVLTIVSE